MPLEALDVAISIVNTSNRDLLRACLASLPQACEGLRWHATVVDNASEDGSAEMVTVEFPWAGLLPNPARLGFSANHNKNLRRVLELRTARYALILNEDTELGPGSVHELVAFCDTNPHVGAAGPVIRGGDGQIQSSFFRFPTVRDQVWGALRPARRPRAAAANGWLNGSCVLLRTDALCDVGPLDERFFIFFEDTDLGLRLHRAGWSSAVCPGSSILHHGHETVSRPAPGSDMERQMMRSQYLYFRRHHSLVETLSVAVLVRVALLVRAAKATVLGVAGDEGERATARLLLHLARYDPRSILPHESPAGYG